MEDLQPKIQNKISFRRVFTMLLACAVVFGVVYGFNYLYNYVQVKNAERELAGKYDLMKKLAEGSTNTQVTKEEQLDGLYKLRGAGPRPTSTSNE